MKTKRLFDESSYIREFTATVLSCEQKGKGYEIVLDETAFFPEVGGQPADAGKINDATVLDVQEKGDVIVHYLETPFAVGEKVRGTLDWEKRFSIMQGHSGEHLVTGIIHSRYGFDNIGFHMGKEAISIDFNGDVPEEDLLSIEKAANEAVWANVSTEILYPDAETLKTLEYRSKKEIEGQVRIVVFPGYDSCACCGTHIARTGEIGMIKIIGTVRMHGGTRIDIVCGRQALEYLDQLCAGNRETELLLSAKPLETAKAVRKLFDDRFDLTVQLSQMKHRLYDMLAKTAEGKENCLLFAEDLTSDGVRELTIAAMEYCTGIAAVFSGDEENGYKYAVGGKNADLREFGKELNKALQGRGGGKPIFIQGSVQAKRGEIETFFADFT